MKLDIVRRYRHNPILTKAEIPYPVETVHNAAVVKHGNEYIMLFRSHLRTGRSIIGLARSSDGFRFTADPQPFLIPDRDSPFAAYEEFGVEDPRVTRLEGEYIITYSAYSRNGFEVMMMMAFLKSTVLPKPSVSWPSSNTCNRMLKTSGCAFSISSSRTTE